MWEGDELPEQFVARRDAYMKEEFAKLLTADAGKLERLGYKSVDGAEEWVTVEVSDGAALIPFWIDLSDEGLYLSTVRRSITDSWARCHRRVSPRRPNDPRRGTQTLRRSGSLRCDRLYESSGVGTCDNRRETEAFRFVSLYYGRF